MKHSEGGLLCHVLLHGSTVTRSSLEVLLGEASPVFVIGACSCGLSLMVTNLSLAFSESMSEQTVGWLGPTMGCRSFTWGGIPSTIMLCALVIPVTRSTLYFVVHRPCGVFTHTRSPGLKTACCWLCVGADVPMIPLSHMRYQWTILASAVAEVISSFGMTLYQYTASGIVHCFLAATFFTVLWHCSMMPLPEGTYAQRNWSRTLHSSRKVLNRLLRKAVSLSVKISVGRPCS